VPTKAELMNDTTAAIEIVTPSRAVEWLELNIENNRFVRDRVVTAYAAAITNGDWMLTGEAIKFDRDGKLIDGQHRLLAVVAAQTAIPVLVVRGLDPAVVSLIDTNIRRTAGDALRFAGIVTHNQFEVAAAARLALARDRGGLSTYGKVQASVSHVDILNWVRANPDIAGAAALARRMFAKLGCGPSPLAYAIWHLSNIDAVDALAFFEAVAELRTNGSGDPRYALIRALSGFDRIARHPGATVGLIFAAWNAYRDGVEVASLPTRDADGKPLKIQEPR
jgi:hypothetical protein